MEEWDLKYGFENVGPSVSRLLEEMRFSREWFRDKKVLDVGCGDGRNSMVLQHLGAEVEAFDYSPVAVQKLLRSSRNTMCVTCSDLFDYPYEPVFDLVLAWGVLHHTRDTREALERIVGAVKSGGFVFLQLYERTNPVREFNTNLLRAVLRLLPLNVRFGVAKEFWAGYSLPSRAARKFVQLGHDELSAWDCYSPRYNHTHVFDQVHGWLEELGFSGIKCTSSVHNTGFRRWLDGEHGGTLFIRAQKEARE